MDYGNPSLFGLPDVTIKTIERLQHAAARLILNRSWRDSATEMVKELHWLPIRYRIRSIGRKLKLHQKTENKDCDDNHICICIHSKFDNSKVSKTIQERHFQVRQN